MHVGGCERDSATRLITKKVTGDEAKRLPFFFLPLLSRLRPKVLRMERAIFGYTLYKFLLYVSILLAIARDCTLDLHF